MTASIIPQASTVTRSRLFGVYNRARSARARTLGVERGRLNRALGLVQRGHVRLLDDGTAMVRSRTTPGIEYHVTHRSCQCKDAQHRPQYVCQHRQSFWLALRAAEPVAPAPAPQPAPARKAWEWEPTPLEKRRAWKPTPEEEAALEDEIDALFGER